MIDGDDLELFGVVVKGTTRFSLIWESGRQQSGLVTALAHEKLQDDILDELVDGWFCFSQLMYLARVFWYCGTGGGRATLSAVASLLREGKVVSGDLGDGFEPWEIQGEEAAERISERVHALPTPAAGPGELMLLRAARRGGRPDRPASGAGCPKCAKKAQSPSVRW